MNINMVNIIKRIIAEQGENILADPQRLKSFVADYASQESKAERLAFGRCIEYGAYTELKDAEDRQTVKSAIARRVRANEGLDIALCNDMLDALEAALFGERASKKSLCLKCGRELEVGWAVCPFCGVAKTVTQRQETVMAKNPSPDACVNTVAYTPMWGMGWGGWW
jgi:RNA polymerase subunit RPABC4/transcription elongation factor Spt4